MAARATIEATTEGCPPPGRRPWESDGFMSVCGSEALQIWAGWMDVFLADIESINRFAEEYQHRVAVVLPADPGRRRAFLAEQLPIIERMLGNPLGQVLRRHTRERLEALWLTAAEAAESGA